MLTRQNCRSSITVGDTAANVMSAFDLESSALEDEILTLRSEPDQHLLKLGSMQCSGNYGGGEASQSQRKCLELDSCCISIRLLIAQFQSAFKAFSRHLWYLTLEMVPLSLFSFKLNEVEKLELVDCLLALKPKEPIPFPQCQSSTGYGKPSVPEKYWQLPYFGTLGHLYSRKQWSFLFWLEIFQTGNTHQYIYNNALVKIDANNMIYDSTERGVETWMRCVCCTEVLATLSKFRTSGGTGQKKHPSLRQPSNKKMTENWHFFAVQSLVTHTKYNSDNCIALMIIIFYYDHGHWRSPVVKPTQNFGGKCLTLGKQQHFCLGRRFSKHKMTRYAKILSACPLGSP